MCELHSPTFDVEPLQFCPWQYLWPFLDQEEAIYKKVTSTRTEYTSALSANISEETTYRRGLNKRHLRVSYYVLQSLKKNTTVFCSLGQG